MGEAPADDLAVVLAIDGPHGPVIHAANRVARLAGAAEGGRIVDMRALRPDLQVHYADPGGEAALLERLVFWARRWCPWTAADGPRGLILDTTGSDHLFGGEAALLAEMEAQLSLLGFCARLALAPTRGAAWGLARHGRVRAICGAGALADSLAPLPVAALRLEAETLLLLHRLGLKRIGALAGLPRPSLSRRFVGARPEANPLIRLDQALGRLAEPLSCPGETPRLRSLARLSEPTVDPTHFLPALCRELCDRLDAAGQGCRRLRVTVFRTDGETSGVTVALAAPSRDAEHLRRLFDGKLERIDPGFGFDLIALEALAVEPLSPSQARLGGGADKTRAPAQRTDTLPALVQTGDTLSALAQTIDRLSARFGARAITRPVLQASNIPERAEAQVSALAAAPVHAARPDLDRPIRLMTAPEEIRALYALPDGPPAQFVWRRRKLQVLRHAGPERIAPEWWRDRSGARSRDYFKVEVETGQRFWIYREGLHADGRGGDPRWFLHGIFA